MKPMHTLNLRAATAMLGPWLAVASCGGQRADGAQTAPQTANPGAAAPTTVPASSAMTAAGAAAPAQTTPTAAPTAAAPAQAAAAAGPQTSAATTPPPGSVPASTGAAGAAGAAAPGMTMAEAAPGAPMMAMTGGLPATPQDGPAPKIPEVMGDCPEFKDGTTIMIGGHRNVMITTGPPGRKGALLFYWHGTGSSAEYEVGRLPAPILEDVKATGSIIAGFNGSGSAGGKGDCSGTAAHNIADFDAADQLVACAVKNHGIDPRRIYSAGCSAGGLQTGCMAMMRSSYLAAVAPNSGGIVSPQPWQDMHSPAVMTLHGGASDMVIVTFSQTSASFDMQAKSHGGFVINCDHGGGHCAAPDELKVAYWQFLKDHPFGIDKSPWEAGFPSGVPDYCKIY